MLLLLSLVAHVHAAKLPGIDLPFDVTDEGRWVLADDLPEEFTSAGVEPGWELQAVDGTRFTTGAAARRRVAAGGARLVQLEFLVYPDPPAATEEGEEAAEAPPPAEETPDDESGEPVEVVPEEVVVEVPRAPFAHADEVGLLPWPDGFTAPAKGWQVSGMGLPLAVDTNDQTWALDVATGAWTPAQVHDATALTVPEVWWALSDASWAVVRDSELSVVRPKRLREQFATAARLSSFQGNPVEHLAVPEDGGVAILEVELPRGTRSLPVCLPDVPETCLVAGRQVAAELSHLQGAQEEAQRMLGVACSQGVYRACLESLAMQTPSLQPKTQACIDRDVNACHEVARQRVKSDPEATDALSMGLFEFACTVDASGSIGERLRRLEDVGEGCMLLSAAFDRKQAQDRALLSLDQACVLGRADACEEAKRRRDEAFALRTVSECEDPELPLASACVQLGDLLQVREIGATELDDFDAYQRGCELGDEEGCKRLGDYVDRWGITHPRVVAAEQQLQTACDQGEQRACIGTGHLLVRHDPKSEAYGKALTLFSAACAAGESSGCIAGAEQRRIGNAKKVEAPEPLSLWGSACDLSSAPGCLGLGDKLVRSKKTWPDAYTAWSRACDTGAPHACTEIGLLVREKHDPWPEEQPSEVYLEEGCETGDAEGCYWLAETDLPKKGEPPEPAYLLLEQSCEGEFGQGCADLAEVHLGRKTSFDDEIAAGHFQSACANAHFESCKELGQMYLRGKGVEKDRVKAKEFLQKFNVNAQRRHVRLGLQLGFPYLAGGQLELVAPIPVGPAISVHGSYSYLPNLGGFMLQLDGQTAPSFDSAPTYTYADAGVRLYPNNKARGLYGMGAFHTLQAQGARTRIGPSARLGMYSENKWLYTRVEMGLGSYGAVRLQDFDEDETGEFPLLQATLGFSIGLAPI